MGQRLVRREKHTPTEGVKINNSNIKSPSQQTSKNIIALNVSSLSNRTNSCNQLEPQSFDTTKILNPGPSVTITICMIKMEPKCINTEMGSTQSKKLNSTSTTEVPLSSSSPTPSSTTTNICDNTNDISKNLNHINEINTLSSISNNNLINDVSSLTIASQNSSLNPLSSKVIPTTSTTSRQIRDTNIIEDSNQPQYNNIHHLSHHQLQQQELQFSSLQSEFNNLTNAAITPASISTPQLPPPLLAKAKNDDNLSTRLVTAVTTSPSVLPTLSNSDGELLKQISGYEINKLNNMNNNNLNLRKFGFNSSSNNEQLNQFMSANSNLNFNSCNNNVNSNNNNFGVQNIPMISGNNNNKISSNINNCGSISNNNLNKCVSANDKNRNEIRREENRSSCSGSGKSDGEFYITKYIFLNKNTLIILKLNYTKIKNSF